MQSTRAFKNGNSQAIRIPADLAYERTDMDLEIERHGEELRIRPARRSLADFMKDGREDHTQADRDTI
jgi:antitoxin VapB